MPEEMPRRRDWYETRDLILSTFARMVVNDGLRDVSIQQVADRAGITHRTIYRHFATRQELIDQLAVWLNERGRSLGEVAVPAHAEDIPAAIIQNARVFDQEADLIKALVLVTWESGMISRLQAQRTDEFEKALAPLTAHLGEDQARAVVALIRYLASSRTWLTIREEFDLTGEQSAPVVAWAVQMMLDALRDQARPGIGPAFAASEDTRDDD
jgi:AcrR family transcriptional regulator